MVEQVDRDAAAGLLRSDVTAKLILAGKLDDMREVQAFALHRTTSLAAQDGLVEALVKAAQAVVDVDTLALAELEKMGIGLYPETRALTEQLRNALSAIKGDKS